VDLRHSNRFVRVELDVTKVADTIDVNSNMKCNL